MATNNGHETFTRDYATTTATTPRLMKLGDLLESWETDAEATHDAFTTGSLRGPITGITKLDQELGGVLASGLHILHGQPGSGKTAFVLQLAGSCGYPALFLTCEMGPLELFRRVVARVTETFLGRFKTGEFPPDTSLALARRAAAAVPNLVLADATQAFASPEWICAAAQAARGDAQDLLVVVDSVHSWSEGAPIDASEYDRLNAALATLRALARELNCPVVGVAERNRASMASGGLSAGAGSRKFEYGAETVLDLGREKDSPPNAAGEVDIEIIIAKNRNGSPGRKIPLKFHGALQRFRED